MSKMSKANVRFIDYCEPKKWPTAAKYQFRFCYVFDDFVGKNFFCITKDDAVYAFGSNSYGCLGFDHNQPVDEPTLIEELCSMKICQVYRGQTHMLARNEKNEVFCWGNNTCGQLGIGMHKKFVIYKAQMNQMLSQKSIVEISCGSNHSLGLSSNGEVFSWGANDHGQIGCGSPNKFHSKPVKLTFFRNMVVKAICCGSNHSIAMTSFGQMYAWGDNGYGQLGIGTDDDLINTPTLVDLTELNSLRVDKVICSKFSTYFLMSDKTLYFYGTTDQDDSADLNQLSNNTKIVDMHAVHHCHKGYIFTAVTDNMVYEIVESWKEFEKHNNFNNLVEFYAKKYRITYKLVDFDFKPKLINFKSNQSLGTLLKTRSFDNIALTTNRQMSKTSFETFESRFKNIHEIKGEIGTGTFGTVYKVKHVLDNQLYAVKKIMTYDVTDEWKLLEELKNFTQKDHSHVVNYYSVWMENEECIYIQMEYCETNLGKMLGHINDMFDRHDANPAMKTIEYFIWCEILKEILKGLKCLHNCEPQVIHGNLNLHNILISYTNIGKSFVKLGGYGLAKYKYIYEISVDDPNRARHIAPEVHHDEGYHEKSDIYSLGIICRDLFECIMTEPDDKETRESPFEDKMAAMRQLIDQMLLYPNWNERPSCKEILSLIEEWSVKWEQISRTHESLDLRSIFVNFLDNQFLYKFLSVKTGKGFDKIVLNKPEKQTGKSKIASIYRSNSVSQHWKKNMEKVDRPCSLDQQTEDSIRAQEDRDKAGGDAPNE